MQVLVSFSFLGGIAAAKKCIPLCLLPSAFLPPIGTIISLIINHVTGPGTFVRDSSLYY